jgi:hypothetical protein
LLTAMVLASGCSALLTPAAAALFSPIRPNTAHMLSDVCALGLAASLLGWVRSILADTAGGAMAVRHRIPVTAVYLGYAIAAGSLAVLFAVAPRRPEGVGFYRDFAGNPSMQAFWIVFAGSFAYGLAYAGLLFARAAVDERGLRRVCVAVITVGCALGTLYSAWKIVLVMLYISGTPEWAQHVSSVLIVAFITPITVGVSVPPLVGAALGARAAVAHIRRLAPLHTWLMGRYPQLRYRRRVFWRPSVQATDMFIEIADGLHLLQRDCPAVAADHDIDDASITAVAGDAPTDYVQTAARLFTARVRSPGQPAV